MEFKGVVKINNVFSFGTNFPELFIFDIDINSPATNNIFAPNEHKCVFLYDTVSKKQVYRFANNTVVNCKNVLLNGTSFVYTFGDKMSEIILEKIDVSLSHTITIRTLQLFKNISGVSVRVLKEVKYNIVQKICIGSPKIFNLSQHRFMISVSQEGSMIIELDMNTGSIKLAKKIQHFCFCEDTEVRMKKYIEKNIVVMKRDSKIVVYNYITDKILLQADNENIHDIIGNVVVTSNMINKTMKIYVV